MSSKPVTRNSGKQERRPLHKQELAFLRLETKGDGRPAGETWHIVRIVNQRASKTACGKKVDIMQEAMPFYFFVFENSSAICPKCRYNVEQELAPK